MEIGLAVGGAFLSSGLQVLFDRLSPQGELIKMFRKHKHDVRLLKKLETMLLGLQIVLSDAENKQASNRHISQWLNKLQTAVDDAENLIEEVNYEALRLKVEGQHQSRSGTSNQQVSHLNLCLSDDFFGKIKEKLEETIEKLEDLQKQIGLLGLKEHFVLTKQETRRPSTSLVDESDVFGRQSEIDDLIGHLLAVDANGKNLTVIPIVGMGGVGKTTLAKAIYNHEKVKDHFGGLRAWFCVSEAYNAFGITKGLLQEFGEFELKVDDNPNQLQVKLKEILRGKKFLVVLDDVWNDSYNEWDELRNLFVQGDTGSKIIVTTRKESVALMIGNDKISMDKLSVEVSWSLFKRHAFENMDSMEYPELEEVGKQIAAKCKGLPLALKTLAGMLRSKSNVEEWKHILKSEIWELPDKDILPALTLSYNDLPTHLKQCFSYCSIYPKDYPFRKERVIHLWIANGLIPQQDESIEDLGNRYFDELRSRSLFERVPNPSRGKSEKFLMHDLVNDLAQIASSRLCIMLEESQGFHMLRKSRHLSYSMSRCGEFEKLTSLFELEQLRTLLPIYSRPLYHPKLSKRVLHNILPRLSSLRAISLSRYENVKLPNDMFIKLKLLKFLDLSWTKIKKLPESICALYNLDTLLLSSCKDLEELPPQMEKLINLRHLDISNTFRLKMSLYLTKLKSLQVLVGAKFLLGGSKLEDLGELHNLYGSLSILELQYVVDRKEALRANIREKNHVKKLSLEWSESIADNSQTERDILDELRPNTNVKKVEITGYRGTQLPNWLADHSYLKLLKQLSLSNCKDCYSLPALGQLPSLKYLFIRGMHGIREVMEEFYGSSSSQKPFKSLKKLQFFDMPEWMQWHILGNGEFPTLQNLSIVNCPKLTGRFPESLCSLTKLTIKNCPELSLESPIQLSSLKRFEVIGSPKVGVLFDEAELFNSQLQGMKQIVELIIRECNSLTSLPFSILPSTLKRIWISGCRKLKLEGPAGDMISSSYCNMFLEELKLEYCDSIDDIPSELVPRARSLWVKGCHNLTRFLISTGTQRLRILFCRNLEILSVECGTQMTFLDIRECKKLKRLPERMQELLPSLKELYLYECPEIESFPEGGLPFNLQFLEIRDCEKMVKTLSSQVLKSLTSLIYLDIGNLPQAQSLLEEGLPSSLSGLKLYKLDSLPREGLWDLTTLQNLDLSSCDQLQSLAELALPSSLSTLKIRDCANLQSLADLVLPSSLSKLFISECPNLQSLPVKGMPSSLSTLYIRKCPLLEPLVEYEKGEYWPYVARIPNIRINSEEYL